MKRKHHKSHPFGILIRKHLRQGDGLTQSKLAEEIGTEPSVIARMCQGERLTNRDRILEIIRWFYKQGVLKYEEEATALLEAANHARLNANQPKELGIELPKRDIRIGKITDSLPLNQWHGVIDINPKGLAIIEGYNLWFSSFADRQWRIWHLDSSSGRVQPITFNIDDEVSQLDQFVPVISPDCKKVAFSAGWRDSDDNYHRNLYLVNLDGTNVKKLTDSKLDVYHPSWSPDGRLLAYSAQSFLTSKHTHTRYGIWVLDLENGQSRQLTNEGDYDPVWSPNGQYIASYSMIPSWNIKILDYNACGSSTNSCPTWIAVANGGYATSAGWINEHKIVFASDIAGHWHIYEIPIKPGYTYANPIQITHGQWDNVYPAVFDNKILLWQAFQHEREGNEGDSTDKDAVIYVMNLDHHEELPLIIGIGNARDGFLNSRF